MPVPEPARAPAAADPAAGIDAVRIRPFALADHAALVQLWAACGLHRSRSDRMQALALKLERDPDLFLVAEFEGRLVGSLMGTWDGRRGWVNRLAVAEAFRGRGLARQLMALLERRLRERGCEKVNLLIERDNVEVSSFYAGLGYAADDLVFMEKWIAPRE